MSTCSLYVYIDSMHSVYYLPQAMLRIDDLLSHAARSVTNRKSQKMRNSFTATGHPVQDVPDWLATLWGDMTSHISELVASRLKNVLLLRDHEENGRNHRPDSHLPAIQLWSVCNACVRIRICLQTIYILTSAAGAKGEGTVHWFPVKNQGTVPLFHWLFEYRVRTGISLSVN